MSKKTKTSEQTDNTTEKKTRKRRVKPVIIEETIEETIEEHNDMSLLVNHYISKSKESVMAISWIQNKINAVLLGEFEEILDFANSNKNLTPMELFQLIDDISNHTKLSILINESGFKTGYSDFIEKLNLYHPELIIKKMNVPLNSSADIIIERFMRRLDWKFLEGKTIVSLSA